ncbi:hypothetical protein AAX26_00698 [Aliarcobacter thereius]|uniref:Uncharacterized protein n=1 Tax=Aliarcobacter thereius TaxID=544718 RepID=A0A1C0B8E3_9BACT|nr:hypothetical protein [Aliarcobacter thereius]OCL87610.1 hypothetical protein AAX26_00698 [Aliarcobacter thereius]OCL99847.1 hypothetical protein AAX29_00897 [Aliarcobacter thereius]
MKITNSIYRPKNLEELAKHIKKSLDEKKKESKIIRLSKKIFNKK